MKLVVLMVCIFLGGVLQADDKEVLRRASDAALADLGISMDVSVTELELRDEPEGYTTAAGQITISGQAGDDIVIRGVGAGATNEEALEDLAGYFRRVIPYELQPLLQGPRIAYIDRMFVYLHIPEEDPAREYRLPQGVVRSAGALEGTYLRARLIYSHKPIVPGTALEPVSRIGLTMTARGGYAFADGTGTASLEAGFDGHGGRWYPLIRLGLELPDGLMLQAGWGLTLAPRFNLERHTPLHSTALRVYTAAGRDFSASRWEGTA